VSLRAAMNWPIAMNNLDQVTVGVCLLAVFEVVQAQGGEVPDLHQFGQRIQKLVAQVGAVGDPASFAPK